MLRDPSHPIAGCSDSFPVSADGWRRWNASAPLPGWGASKDT